MRGVALAVTAVGYALVSLAAPLAVAAVFLWGADRANVATWTFVAFGTGITAAFVGPLVPAGVLSESRDDARARRTSALRFASRNYLLASAVIHLTWELGWLCLHHTGQFTANSAGEAWLYPWWVYIDAGDRRYLTAPPDLVAMEWLSVCNGGLILWGLAHGRLLPWSAAGPASSSRSTSSGGHRPLPASSGLAFAAATAIHFYSATLYFVSEAVAGLPNCDTARPLNVAFAFVMANAPWVYMPLLAVFPWLHAEFSGARNDLRLREHPGRVGR